VPLDQAALTALDEGIEFCRRKIPDGKVLGNPIKRTVEELHDI